MPPNQQANGVLYESDDYVDARRVDFKQEPREYRIIWKNVFAYTYLHIAAIYATYLMFTSAKILTTANAIIFLQLGNLAVSCGVHRLFSHRTYKATTPLKIIYVFFQTLAFHDSIILWSRNHRLHHKYSETDIDPHNPSRGLFYAHCGWVLTKKLPIVREKEKCIDISDLTSDPLVYFQHKYYLPLMLLTAVFLPTVMPMWLWGETFSNAWHLNTWRLCMSLNIVFSVNSLSHAFGNKPYDKNIGPTENRFVAAWSLGEGYHNYHHVFPWDYKASEFGKYFNIGTAVIDFFARIGWAYDLKTTTEEMVRKRALRTGDGSRHVWGWNDKDMLKEDIQNAVILNKQD